VAKHNKKAIQFIVKEKIDVTGINLLASESSEILRNIRRAKYLTDSKKIPFFIKIGLNRKFNVAAALYIEAYTKKQPYLKKVSQISDLVQKELKRKKVEIFEKAKIYFEEIRKESTISHPQNQNFGNERVLHKLQKKQKEIEKWKRKNIVTAEEKILKKLNQNELMIFQIEEKARKQIGSIISPLINKGVIFYTTNISNIKSKEIIICKNLNKKIKTKNRVSYVLKDINLIIQKGEMVAIMGASGSGKTTLLNIISGIDHGTTGDVLFEGTNINYLTEQYKIKFRQKYVSIVFEGHNLLENISAISNAHVGSIFSKKKLKKKNFYEIFEILGLKGLEKKKPSALSGGQQQRVAIARALLKNPSVLFCDEPTAGLDKETAQEIINILKQLQQKYNTTIVMVTNSPYIARQANRIIEIKEGKIVPASIKTDLEENAEAITSNIFSDLQKNAITRTPEKSSEEISNDFELPLDSLTLSNGNLLKEERYE